MTETKLGIGLTRLNRDFCPNFYDLFKKYTVSLKLFFYDLLFVLQGHQLIDN